MRIAMIGWEYPPWTTGGLGTHCTELVRELVAQGAHVDFYVPVPAPFHVREREREGVTFHYIPLDAVPEPYATTPRAVFQTMETVDAFARSVVKAAEGHPATVVHAHDWMGIPAATALSAHQSAPLVLTIHSTEYDRAAGAAAHPTRLAMEREGVRSANAVIAVSEATRQATVDGLQADPAKVRVIHNGINAARFQPPAARDYAAEPPTVLFLGRLTRQKGPDVFLDAAYRVLTHREASFVMAGEGDMRTALLARARRLGLSRRVRFAGRVEPREMPRIYRDAAVYVMPSRSEPFGITALEAICAGTPVVASRTAGVCEVVSAITTVDPGDPDALAEAIRHLLDHPEERRRLAERALHEAGPLTWTAAAKRTLEVYAAVARARPEPAAAPLHTEPPSPRIAPQGG